MRIVGGKYRGRRLDAPKNQAIRPTTDRNRETLFNILQHGWCTVLQSRVLDLFAGTGALGLEALSRGASHVHFMEKNRQAVALINRNIEILGVEAQTSLQLRDATRPGIAPESEKFDLVFADPPYGKQLGERAALALVDNGWLASNGLLVLEEQKSKLPPQIEGFDLRDRRDLGETAIGLFQFVA
ncbi:MAG: 16S rRNA (guanine(966)-N(2))-methyltransferase RsmD [Rhizobiaceae bacterium]